MRRRGNPDKNWQEKLKRKLEASRPGKVLAPVVEGRPKGVGYPEACVCVRDDGFSLFSPEVCIHLGDIGGGGGG